MALAWGSVTPFSTKPFCVVYSYRPLIPLALLANIKRGAREAIVFQLPALHFWLFVLLNAPLSFWNWLQLGEKSPAKVNQ